MIDPEIIEFYNDSSEKERMKYGLGPLERERNEEIISRFLPEKPIKIADIGGGPGVYTQWLADLGHQVQLVDPVPRHIDEALKICKKFPNQVQAILGHAGELPFEDHSCEIVILHGPLYHLQDPEERQKALLEAKRILKPGGTLLAWAITHTASALVGLLQGVLYEDSIYNMALNELKTGIHEAPQNMPGVLQKAYYHKPEELKQEILEAGFTHQQTLPVEGMVWLDQNYFDSRSSKTMRQKMLELVHTTEADESLLVFSPHVVACATVD